MRTIIVVGTLVLAGCAATPKNGASAAQHDLEAAAQDREAELHSARIDRNAERVRCTWEQTTGFESCWTPASPDRAEAEAHRRAAAVQRAASQRLRDAEALTCASVAEEDRDISPFAHRADIVRVGILHPPGGPVDRIMGAVIELRPVSGLTPSILQRIVDCHLARNAALGNHVPEMSYCPLVPRGVQAKVEWVDSRSTGLVVEISAPDEATGREVWRRASALKD